MNMSA